MGVLRAVGALWRGAEALPVPDARHGADPAPSEADRCCGSRPALGPSTSGPRSAPLRPAQKKDHRISEYTDKGLDIPCLIRYILGIARGTETMTAAAEAGKGQGP